MATYLVLTPPGGSADHGKTRFIRDGFSIWAFLFPAIWLFVHRLWLAGIIVLIVQMIAGALMEMSGFAFAGLAISVALGMLAALEGPTLHAMILQRRGWVLDDIIVADDVDTAEEMYFVGLPQTVTPERRPADWSQRTQAQAAGNRGGPALGLFDFDGGR